MNKSSYRFILYIYGKVNHHKFYTYDLCVRPVDPGKVIQQLPFRTPCRERCRYVSDHAVQHVVHHRKYK